MENFPLLGESERAVFIVNSMSEQSSFYWAAEVMHSSPCQLALNMPEASRLRTEMLIIQLSCRSIDYLQQ